MKQPYEPPEIRKLENKDLHLLVGAFNQNIDVSFEKPRYYPGLQTNLNRIWRGRK